MTLRRRLRLVKTGELIAQEIVSDMRAARVRGGDVLQTETLMLRQYPTGRASLRQALRLLEACGVLRVRSGSGRAPVISAVTPASVAPLMSTFLSLSHATYADLHDFLLPVEMRLDRMAIATNPVYCLIVGSLRLIGNAHPTDAPDQTVTCYKEAARLQA